jgi:hypothetical protein
VPDSILITLHPPARIQSCEQLFSETEPFTLEGEKLYPGTAPGWWMFDLLVRRKQQGYRHDSRGTKGDFCGVVYWIAGEQRPCVHHVCKGLNPGVVRYCASFMDASRFFGGSQEKCLDVADWQPGDFVPSGFPTKLLGKRELMNDVLLGRKDRSALAADLREVAAFAFETASPEAKRSDLHRVEVLWAGNESSDSPLPSENLDVEFAQLFAEDIWYYRDATDDRNRVRIPIAFALNHIPEILTTHKLSWPADMAKH